MSVRHSCRLSNRSTSLSARAGTARRQAHAVRASFVGTPRLARKRLVQLIHFAIGASAGGLMLGAHAQTSGNPCAGLSANICTIGAAGYPGTPGPKSDLDKSGNPGTSAGTAPALTATFSESSSTVFRSVGSAGDEPSAIGMLSIGGTGGNGSDASGGNSTLVPLTNLNGGDGGTAGAGGSVALTITSGAQVQAIMAGPANVGAAGQAPAISVVSQGGAGGGGGVPSTGGTQGTSQIGGSAGDVTVQDMANPNQVNPLTGSTAAVIGFGSGIYAASVGGNGGTGNPHVTSFSKFGVDGADSDAPGGNVTVITGTSIVGFANGRVGGTYPSDQGAGIWAVSAGGNGGAGGSTGTAQAGGQGGTGGAGAPGGNVVVTVQSGSVATQAGTGTNPMTPAVWAQSLGGIGGAGGAGGGVDNGGIAGQSGNAGSVTVTNDGTLSTAGASHSPGILAQSLGGAGANGGKGGGFGASGGEGAFGGNGGNVLVGGSGNIATSTTDSPGVLAQSIGGGGGNGGDSNGWMAVGGAGAYAGSGASVTINSSQTITTSGRSSAGIQAQSIGGGGGNGGDAKSGQGAEINLVIGGSGAAGGNGWTVQAYNSGNIVTSGQHASGMELQSIGGGGGKGGAAFSNDTNGVFGAQESVGGNGGAGGSAAWVGFVDGMTETNTGAIRTSGSDSFGIVAQSIGGGGGIGAASVATSKTYAPDDTPSLSLTASIGGSGGTGGDGSTAQITNASLIATSGAGGIGMIAQSIGGGGGSGGDSSATSSTTGSELNIDASVAIGGKGSAGGDGNAINAANTGLIVTTGESADGILAQSIGGGGGNGGSGDAQAKATGDGTNISASIPIGGNSGKGGNALGLVQASNSGALLTLGDGASGIIAQAVGGGGGRAGGAAGTSKGDFSATVSIGGSGGAGGSATVVDASNNPTASVQVSNSGSIVTFGADASAVVAQSIGGGGGMGGKAATSIGSKKSTGDGGNGSSATNSTLDALANAFKDGGIGSQYTSVAALSALAGQLLDTSPATVAAGRLGSSPADDASDLGDLGEDQGDSGDDSNATSIKTNIAIGGSGGAAGNGGIVQVSNTGSIGTIGVMSDGILAQSIGGGGGKGGAATSSGSLNVDQDSVSAPVAVGGSGGAAGSGSDVTVTNDTNASIITIGSIANGIVAQSIGGGGGMGGVAGGRNGALQGLNVSNKGINIGGDQIGKSNDAATVLSGTVTVNNNAGASILTESHDASGIIAQSIAGGGGIVKAASTDATDNAGGGANPDPVKNNGTFELNVVFGGTGDDGSNGSAGAANVNNSGMITTQGRNSYGVLAQSVGGGGGIVLGGEIAGGPGGFMNTAAMRGNGGDVTVTANSGSSIVTGGQGAVGIFAQSVGGGGGIAGDTGLSQAHLGYYAANNHPGSGNGGTVAVTVGAGSSVQTSGANAPAIIAQSVGGGGGYFTAGASEYAQGLYAGSFGGSGNGGPVNVNVSGTVSATGAASPGIYAQSSQAGGADLNGSQIVVNVNQGATVSGGKDFYHGGDGTAAAIQVFEGLLSIDGTTPLNAVNNNGIITSTAGVNGSAVFSYNGETLVHNGATGVIDGTINLENDGGEGQVVNDPGGTLNTGSTVAAALTRNNGTLDVGGRSAPGAVTLVTGDLAQGVTGNIVIDSDHVAATNDRLVVAGNATLAGQLVMRPARLTNSTLDVIDVKGALDASQLQMSNPYLVKYTLASGKTPDAQSGGQSLYVTPHASFAENAEGLSANAQAVATHLQANFDAGANADALGTAFAQLANGVANHASYNAALNRLGNETQQAVGIASLAASHAFVERMYSCPSLDGPADAMMHERDCVWGRIIDNHTSADGSGTIGYSANTYAMQFGGQHAIGDGWFVGGSVGYDTSNLDGSDGVGDVNGHGPQVGVMLKKEIGNWTISGGADAGYGWYDSTRNVSLPGYAAQAKGDFNSYEAGLHSRIAYTIPMNDWYMKPYLDLHVVHFHTGGFTEQGAGALDLAVNGSTATTLSASPMFEVGGRWTFANGMVLRPDVAAGAIFHNRNHWDSSAQFVGSAPGVAPFTAVSSAPSALAKVKLDMNLSVSKSTEIKLEYGGQFGSGYSSNEGILRVNHLF